jgi:CHAT domain-containing protein
VALSHPEPLSVEQVQAELNNDEALVLFLDTPEMKPTPEESFIWVVTKVDSRWAKSELGTKALTDEVAALRCGLDATAWDDASDWSEATQELVHQRAAQIARRQRCEELVKAKPTTELFGLIPVEVLPFDLARAHRLYTALLGQVEDLIKSKHLLIVPSGALTQLPFQVLVTAPPTNSKHKSAAWLARSHAITVLPAVSSLKALRRIARPSAATKPMIGFGNPLLEGDQDDLHFGAYYKGLATAARERQACPVAQRQEVASLRSGRRGLAPLVTHRGLVELADLKAQTPLPETANELCAVARDLGADLNEIRLGARATEREIKALSRSGALAQFRIVHFATHGALAGQLSPTAEPGLILTPPANATEEDDGYLSASEIAALKLDADWIVLSACNTAAAAGAGSAEALSGVARAFFYAQARALLVSHWEVNSAATVKLITAAVNEITRDNSVGRAEALRRAMLALIDKGQPYEAHPAYWAPFVVVGEGAAAK